MWAAKVLPAAEEMKHEASERRLSVRRASSGAPAKVAPEEAGRRSSTRGSLLLAMSSRAMVHVSNLMGDETPADEAHARPKFHGPKVRGWWRAIDKWPGGTRLKVAAKRASDSSKLSAFMTAVTLYALFSTDIKLASTDARADVGFTYGAMICFGCFGAEIFMSTLANEGYLGGFYFWFDLISTASVVAEIPQLIAAIQNLFDGHHKHNGADQAHAAKAGKAGKVGSRASRIIRIVRLVRMVRVVKLYRLHSKGDGEGPVDTLEPTQVGRKLTETTTRRLIIMILTMILVLPQLLMSTYIDNSRNFEFHFLKSQLHQYAQSYNRTGEIDEAAFKKQVMFYSRYSAHKLMYLEICQPQATASNPFPQEYEQCNQTWRYGQLGDWVKEARGGSGEKVHRPRASLETPGVAGAVERAASIAKKLRFRDEEYFIASQVGCYRNAPAEDYFGGIKRAQGTGGASFDESSQKQRTYDARFSAPTCISLAMFDSRRSARLVAVMSILKTTMIMLMLVLGSLAFARDAQLFVIGPIERMTTLVKRLSENPLDPANLDANTYLGEDRKVRDQGYETALLEQTLERIGQLLQVGFGAAGAEIIGKNMHADSGRVNAMIPGKKITAIYGFCDIRQFTDTTECLQEEVMVYVNKLGHLVHSTAHCFFGMANKNVGDAFLLSWKVCDGELPGFSNFDDSASETQRRAANRAVSCVATHDGKQRLKTTLSPSQMANAAITGFIKTQIDLENENLDGCLSCYATYDAVIKRFGPGFSIQMGFGMHVGWAIEGAIGSDLKIDATYLSPHVEMSDRLEASSKIFLAKLNISHWLHRLADPYLAQLTRPIACVRAEGVSAPFTVYTFDVTHHEKTFAQRFCAPTDQRTLPPVDFTAKDFRDAQRGLHHSFRATWALAFDAFLKGDWPAAKRGLADTLHLKAGDGPALYTLGVMRLYLDVCPPDWDGSHFLESF
ncbi:hypothetical protein M885DRAFT_533256 [Pelagophyceae sp. CCMP2097]|nr:hypothetical protein M885DRAFT_533256 [Pelagophyceae sp. CCMP2097]|mmetsp:Transcript_11178/g.37260  ORF Transcript_11178/g.37260 Transcript_11178/m.37260 type:complete len:955 (+) Transcript_11178:171-3035(+)